MCPTPEEIREFERELAANRHASEKTKPAGIIGKVEDVAHKGAANARATYGAAQRLKDWGKAAGAATARKIGKVRDILDPYAGFLIRGGAWAAPKLWRAAKKTAIVVTCKKDAEGHRHFDATYAARNTVIVAVAAVATPIALGAAYYYGTLKTYKDVYIPNAGVFQSQNFVHPSKPGQVIAPRDEIFTVLGKQIGADKKIDPIRFDIDTNYYFFLNNDALRPDLAASKMDSQSPYGVKCDVEATGIYSRLPRYWRLWAVKWWDVRPEIVKVIKCEELDKMPLSFEEGAKKPAKVSSAKPADVTATP